MYQIKIRKQAKKKLQSLLALDRQRIVDKLFELALDPENFRLDVKPMKNRGEWRLRVGKWRILFSKNEILKIIGIEKIGSRGDVYK